MEGDRQLKPAPRRFGLPADEHLNELASLSLGFAPPRIVLELTRISLVGEDGGPVAGDELAEDQMLRLDADGCCYCRSRLTATPMARIAERTPQRGA